jgi:hypothetical protein
MSRSVQNASLVTVSLKRSPRHQATPRSSAMSGTGRVPRGLKGRARGGLSPRRIYWMSSTSMPAGLIAPHPPGTGRSSRHERRGDQTRRFSIFSWAPRAERLRCCFWGRWCDGRFFPSATHSRPRRRGEYAGFRRTHERHKPLVGGNRILVNEKSAAHRVARRRVRGSPLPRRAGGTLAQTCNRSTKASATAVGVDVTLEVWNDRPRVRHMVAPIPPEGHQAIERIGGFMRAHTG